MKLVNRIIELQTLAVYSIVCLISTVKFAPRTGVLKNCVRLLAVGLMLGQLSACADHPLQAPNPPAVVQTVPDNWLLDQQNRQQAKASYIEKNQVAFDWFADFAFSETDGTPYIALRLLPVIAPELWGSEDPMPRGIGISALARKDPMSAMDRTSFTCAACHVGRVKDDQGAVTYIDGGVNTEFNIVLYRVKVYQTLQKIYGQETDSAKKQQLLIDAFLTALEKARAISPNFFYKDYKNDWVDFNAEYEKRQIELFTENAADVVVAFADRSVANFTGYGALMDKNYQSIKERSLEGFPGMADATGISSVNAYNGAQKNFFTRLFAKAILPEVPGMTDFMSVWEQDKRTSEWDAKHKTLINGGGQWNGNIPIPMYRNLAAQLTLGLSDNDIRVSAFAVELLDRLPATVYPFDVDVDLAKKGEALFADNCAQCHQPHNGKVYDNLNVNMDRSYVVDWLTRKGGVSSFYAACSPETTVIMEGKATNPCAEYAGYSLEGKKQLIMSPNKQHHGYNARPLSGIWAQAPYLHTGSVPTVYHLLMPKERPTSFIKSRLEYDQEKLGFAWTQAEAPQQTSGYLFDTTIFSTFTNVGHDTDIKDKTYKLDWSDDKAGAMALVEYLKTL